MSAPGFTEKDGLEAQPAADGLLNDPESLHGNVAFAGWFALAEGLAQVFHQGILAAGYRAQAGFGFIPDSHPTVIILIDRALKKACARFSTQAGLFLTLCPRLLRPGFS